MLVVVAPPAPPIPATIGHGTWQAPAATTNEESDMQLLTYQETVRETGIDPAADPDLPELPEWLDHPPIERVADMDTGTIPAVTEEVAA